MRLLIVSFAACGPTPTTDTSDTDTDTNIDTEESPDTGDTGAEPEFTPPRSTETYVQSKQAGARVAYFADMHRGPLAGAWFTGDADADGADEILVWNHSEPSQGEVFMFLPRSISGDVDPSSGVVLTSEPGDGIGSTPTAEIDLSGDGFVDLLRGAPSGGGGVEVAYGPFDTSLSFPVDARIVDGSGSLNSFQALTADLDGDGLGEVLVGLYSNYSSSDGHLGGLYIFEGPLSEDRSFADADASRYHDGGVGACAVGNDVDGDGLPDLLLGGYPGGGTGAWLALSPLVGDESLEDASATLREDEDVAPSAGTTVALPGDVDGDDKGDILLGGYIATDDVEASGTVWLFHGAPSGTVALSDADARLYGKEGCSFAGIEITAAGDTDVDGFADFWVGAPGLNVDYCTNENGHAWLVRGPIEGRFWLDGADIDVVGGEGMGRVISAHPTDGGLLVGTQTVGSPAGGMSVLYETASW